MGAGGRALCLQCLYYARNAIIMNREVANSPKPRAPCSTATLPDGASIHLFFMLSRAIWQLEAFFVHEVVKSSTLCDLAARRGSAEALSRRIEGGGGWCSGAASFLFGARVPQWRRCFALRCATTGGGTAAALRYDAQSRAAERLLLRAAVRNHRRRNGRCTPWVTTSFSRRWPRSSGESGSCSSRKFLSARSGLLFA